MAFVSIGNGVVRVQAQTLLVGSKRFLIPLEFKESGTFARIGIRFVRIQAQSLLVSRKSFLIIFSRAVGISLVQPLLCCLRNARADEFWIVSEEFTNKVLT